MSRKKKPFHIFGTGDSFSVFGGGSLAALDPLPEGDASMGFGDPFSVFGKAQKPERNSVQELQQQEADLKGAAHAAGLGDVLQPIVSGAGAVGDFLSRPNYAIAGGIRELQEGGGPLEAAGRFGSELFRGVPGVGYGETRETFADVLEAAGVSEGPSVPAPFGWGKISTRGTVGLALDIAMDPTTYVTFGGAALTKLVGAGGKVVGAARFSKLGREAIQEVAQRVRPDKLKLAKFLAEGAPVDLPGSPLAAKGWLPRAISVNSQMDKHSLLDIHALADKYAYEEAANVVAGMGRQYLDEGGLKWFGKTMIPGEQFGRAYTHVKGSVSSVLAKSNPGRALLSAAGTVRKTGGKVVSQFDRVYNELTHAARKIPGLQNLFTAQRDAKHRMILGTAADIERYLPENMDKHFVDTTGLAGAHPKFRVPKMPLVKFIQHHIDNPLVYTADKIPEGFKDVPNYAAATMSEVFANEVRLGLVDPEQFRKNYWPHMFDNEPEDLAQFSIIHSGSGNPFQAGNKGYAHGEARGFATMDEAMFKADQLKAAGKITFDLKPVDDMRISWYRRLESHWDSVTAHEMWAAMKEGYGFSRGEAEDWISRTFLPGVKKVLEENDPMVSRLNVKGEPSALAGMTPVEKAKEMASPVPKRLQDDSLGLKGYSTQPKTYFSPFSEASGTFVKTSEIRKLNQFIRNPSAGTSWLSKQGDHLQAAGIIGKLRNAKSLPQMGKILEEYDGLLKYVPEDAIRQVHDALDETGMRKYADSLGKDYKFVDDPLNPFHGYYMPEVIVNQVKSMDERLLNGKEIRPFIKSYDTVNRVFKVGVTLYHPAFHARNAISNVITNFVAIGLDGLNPMKYIQAAQVANPAVDGTFRTPWRRYTYDELRDMMKRFGVHKDFSQISELAQSGADPINRFVAGQVGPPGVRQMNKIISGAGGSVENSARGMLFMQYLAQGQTPEMAATYVKNFLFDYEQMSKVERDVLARMFPFYRWTKKNIALTAQQLVKQPGKYSAMFKAVNAGETGPEADALPFYMRGNLKLKLVKGPGRATFVQGLDLPVSAALNTLFTKDVLTTLRQNMGMIAPALKLIPEVALQRDFFSGRDMKERAQVNSLGRMFEAGGQAMRDAVQLTKEYNPQTGELDYKMNGTAAYLLFRSYAHSRFLNEFDKLATDPADLQKFTLWMATGLQGKEIDLTMDQKKLLRQRIRILEDKLVERGVLREAQQTYKPKGVSY